MPQGFENLDVWKRSVDLSADIYRGTREMRDFGFRDQITRSSLSIASNIAEGMERPTSKDRVKFLHYAKASCAELRTQAIIGIKADLLSANLAESWIEESRELSRMIVGLIRSQQT